MRLAPNFSAVFSAKSLTFNNTAGTFSFTGQALTIGSGGIVNGDGDTMIFGNVVAVGAASVSFNAASGALTFSATVGLSTNTLALDGTGASSSAASLRPRARSQTAARSRCRTASASSAARARSRTQD